MYLISSSSVMLLLLDSHRAAGHDDKESALLCSGNYQSIFPLSSFREHLMRVPGAAHLQSN